MNPEVEVRGRHMTEGREAGFGIELMQKFPVTARLRLEKAVTAAQIAAAKAEVDEMRRMLTAEAETMAVKLLAMRAAVGIAESQAALAETLTEVATARTAADEPAIDAAQMRLEAGRQRNSIRRMQAEIAAMNELLKPMLGLAAGQPLEIRGTLREASAPGRTLPSEFRPDIEAARQRMNAAGQSMDLAKARKWEDISAGIIRKVRPRQRAIQGMVEWQCHPLKMPGTRFLPSKSTTVSCAAWRGTARSWSGRPW